MLLILIWCSSFSCPTKFTLDSAKNIAKTTASDVGNRMVKKVLTPKSNWKIKGRSGRLKRLDRLEEFLNLHLLGYLFHL